MFDFRRVLVRLGLRFANPGEEGLFLDTYCDQHSRFIQFSLGLGGIIFYLFFIWDTIIDPSISGLTHAIRGLLVTPFVWLSALLIGLPAMRRHTEPIAASAVLVCCIALAFIFLLLRNGYDYGAVGVVLTLLFMFALLPLRVPYHAGVSVCALVVFNVTAVIAANAKPGMSVVNNLCLSTACVLGLFSVTVRERQARAQFVTRKELEAARERVEDLLHSMLPRDIVSRIQAGETAIADAYGEVSIVFADLVGFTELTRRVSPTQLVEILNSLFTEFDRLAERFGVEKIKTIGDAYMAVVGISKGASKDHAERAASFALAIQACVSDLSAHLDHPFNIRVGLHVGPVVAGVIGMKRPAFDCWGEAVNLASRLEHSAIPGGILISESAYWRLQSSHFIERLDEMDLKGIGRSKVFLLHSRQELPSLQ